MLLNEILGEKQIKIPLAATDKSAAIAELVDLLVSAKVLTDRDKALTAVLERERTRTTGIGNGIAIPHGKTSAVSGLEMAIGLATTPIDWQSIDGRAVSMVIMVLSPPDQTGPHIQALAHVSRLLATDAFRGKILSAKTPAEAIKLIRMQEEATK